MDTESRAWIRVLRSEGPDRDRAVGRLYELLLRVAHAEAARRKDRLPEEVRSELDDLCAQAASDSVMAVLRKLDTFRGAARFTTWACKFVIVDFSSRLRRRVWRGRIVDANETVWDRMADTSPSAVEALEERELIDALGRAVESDLTERQRQVFRSAVILDIPIDVLAEELNSSRGAIYKVLHDARRALRRALMREGYLEASTT